MQLHSTPAYEGLEKLQQQGKLSAVICQNFHGIPKTVHLDKVIDLNGNIYINQCPHCDKGFDIEYIINSKGIPQCDRCKMAIRLGIRLIGERVDAELMTQAAVACDKADVLLILGKNMYHDKLEYSVAPEHEQLKVLFSKMNLSATAKLTLLSEMISANFTSNYQLNITARIARFYEKIKIYMGQPYPLGASVQDNGINFSMVNASEEECGIIFYRKRS